VAGSERCQSRRAIDAIDCETGRAALGTAYRWALVVVCRALDALEGCENSLCCSSLNISGAVLLALATAS
jgi:hypothetical protein